MLSQQGLQHWSINDKGDKCLSDDSEQHRNNDSIKDASLSSSFFLAQTSTTSAPILTTTTTTINDNDENNSNVNKVNDDQRLSDVSRLLQHDVDVPSPPPPPPQHSISNNSGDHIGEVVLPRDDHLLDTNSISSHSNDYIGMAADPQKDAFLNQSLGTTDPSSNSSGDRRPVSSTSITSRSTDHTLDPSHNGLAAHPRKDTFPNHTSGTSPGEKRPISPTSTSVSPGHARYTSTPKDVVVSIGLSGDKTVSHVINNSNSNLRNNNNNNEYYADLIKGGEAKNNVPTTKAVCAALCTKKLLLFLLLLTFLVVAAAVVIVINFQVNKSSDSAERAAAWTNGTAKLNGKSDTETTPSTSELTSSSSSSSSTSSSSTSSSSTSSSSTSLTLSSSASSSSAAAAATSSMTVLKRTANTTPMFTMPLSYCDADHFACNMWGACLPLRFVCDGYPDCPNGRDEKIGCECSSPGQFRCTNGQCVDATTVCNGAYECLDRTDEVNCTNCPIRCKSNGVCIMGIWHRCNGIFDCEDMSDEMGCSDQPGMRRCSNGVLVETELFCDGVDHCGDNSDEDNCSACPEPNHIPCSNSGGRCIPARWKCDGHKDCSNGEDELQCATCRASQFTCADYSCIDASLRCDGKVDCGQRGGDEDDCLSLSTEGLLLAVSTTTPLGTADESRVPVCVDGWTDSLADQACALMGARSLHSWNIVKKDDVTAALAVVGKSVPTAPLLAGLIRVTACKSNQVVQLSCKEPACGERKVEIMDSLVASGELAPPGKWPWVASLSYLGKPICGAVVVGRRWVLTAAHCIKNAAQNRPEVDFTKVPFYFTVKAGATNFFMSKGITSNKSSSSPELHKLPAPQTFRALNISLHPQTRELSRGRYNWDLALIELDVTQASTNGGGDTAGLDFNDLVQPICLPSLGEVFSKSSHCYIAGWGMINYWQYLTLQDLRDARMSVWSEAECRDSSLSEETITDTDSSLCGGFAFTGAPRACKGDSGGPLMCLDSRSKRYKLAGIVSRGGADCEKSRSTKVVFARVSMAMDWIWRMMNVS